MDTAPKSIVNVPEETAALHIAGYSSRCDQTIVAVFPQLNQAEDAYSAVLDLNGEFDFRKEVIFLPEFEVSQRYLLENENRKSRAFYDIVSAECPIIITTVAAILSGMPCLEDFKDQVVRIAPKSEISFKSLLECLVNMDYDDEPEVHAPGEFSHRGGIIDVFSPIHEHPVRLDFWGDELDSFRLFSPQSQRSLDTAVAEYVVIPRAGSFSESEGEGLLQLLAKLNHDVLLLDFFPSQQMAHTERYNSDKLDLLKGIDNSGSCRRIAFHHPADPVEDEASSANSCFPAIAHVIKELPEEICSEYQQIYQQLIADQLRQWLNSGYCVCFLGVSDPFVEVIQNWFAEHSLSTDEIHIEPGEMQRGFIFPKSRLVILSEKELFYYGHKKTPHTVDETGPDTMPEREPDAQFEEIYVDLDEGDYAVHLLHGIARYHGIEEIESHDGGRSEMILLEFASDTMVYIPVYQAFLVSRYVGTKRSTPTLSRFGGKKWQKMKAEAQNDLKNLALEMLHVQAARLANKGVAFPRDDIDQLAFEHNCPFTETDDQLTAAREIKEDMEKETPMDRLLCGDVGYGKTEVAMRAIFKAISTGTQVAVLVPTTILAQQHFYTFSERFAEYPIIIEMLSRFRTNAEQKQILEKLKSGGIDVIIGTHRLIQKDVKFKSLGLLIIDEEQRFGVEHKERLKRMRTSVDILTMTATPIPRTLYLAMTGMRNLSTIMTPPGQRLPVKTVVCQMDYELIKHAIERELERGGQVFYLHNRVQTIDKTCKALQELVPEARFAVTHGRMNEHALENVMSEFIGGEVDVLVTTTIIESGLDIPNANTIIIERADRFGLAELYQLRGRVGRWNRQAYAYLLLPKQQILTGDARQRIAAMRRYSQLGAGFKLAMRDLEIRGTGNLLGKEQSGNINAIGFDLYCKILRSIIDELKGKPATNNYRHEVTLVLDFVDFALSPRPRHLSAGIPTDYIACEKLRLQAYRRASGIGSPDELADFRDELADRFGPVPEPVDNFLKIMVLKLMCQAKQLHSLKTENKKVILESSRGIIRFDGRLPSLETVKPETKLMELVTLLESVESAGA